MYAIMINIKYLPKHVFVKYLIIIIHWGIKIWNVLIKINILAIDILLNLPNSKTNRYL